MTAKIHFEHLELYGVGFEVMREAFPEAPVVLLYRDNVLNQYVSWKLAKASGVWLGRSQAAVQREKVRFDQEEFDSYVRRSVQRHSMALADSWVRKNLLIIQYEALAQDPQGACDREVFPFLGVASVPVSASLVKQNNRTCAEAVLNYGEVSSASESARLSNHVPDLKKHDATLLQ